MPPRRQGTKTGQKHEMEAFAEKYDTYALLYGDPVETVFEIMARSMEEDVRLRAAEMLMSYRYPRVKAMEGSGNKAPMMNFNVILPEQKPAELPVNEPRRAPVLVLTEKK